MGLPRRVVPSRTQCNIEPRFEIKDFIVNGKSLVSSIPNISSADNASNILDAPIIPERHAENTAAIIP
ncbi:unnamed protein product, partial [Rotaria socialis]